MMTVPELERLYTLFLNSPGVSTDTRNIVAGNIFFCLKGEKFNANLFAQHAIEAGAAYVVVDEIAEPSWREKYRDNLILVENVLKILQQLAGFHRKQFRCPVLAITGSNGKTTTKELVAAVLSKKFKTYATKGNLNNHIGIPLTLLSVKSDAEFMIIEMGANHQEEIASYCEYVHPDYGLITNIGLAHIEGFGSFEGIQKGKSELYQHLQNSQGKVFVNGSDEVLLENLFKRFKRDEDVIMYGRNEGLSKLIYRTRGEIINKGELLSARIINGPDSFEINSQLVGTYNFSNLLAAVCVGQYFGVQDADVLSAIETYIPTNNRSQKISYGSNTIILDAYNANPSSMKEALDNFESIEAESKVVILGEMMELGDGSMEEHEKIKRQTEEMQLVNRVFVGEGFRFLDGKNSALWFEKTEDAKSWFKQQHFKNCHILIKGSRRNELENILKE